MAVEGRWPRGWWKNVLRHDACPYCHRRAHGYGYSLPRHARTIDHIVPRQAGGTSEAANYTGCCHRCNTGKTDTPLLLFLLARPGRQEVSRGQ